MRAQYRLDAIEVRHPGPNSILRGSPSTTHHRSEWSQITLPSVENIEAWATRYAAAAGADKALVELLGKPEISSATITENVSGRVVAVWRRPIAWSK